MSDKSRRDRKAIRKALLSRPCIYCGGSAAATTTDHMPSRSLFNDATWPEGFEFPACARCQKISRYAETMIGFLSVIYSDPDDPPSETEKRKRFTGLRRNYPRVYLNLFPSKEKVAKLISDHGWPVDPVTNQPALAVLNRVTGQLSPPVVSLDHPEVHEAVRLFGRKLACAIHYYETGLVVPITGAIHVRWYSNMQLIEGTFPEFLHEINKSHRHLTRSNRTLNKQFTYGSAISEEKDSGIYVATFRRSFALQMSVVCEREFYPEVAFDEWVTPFHHVA
jgi:hypothetical protein